MAKGKLKMLKMPKKPKRSASIATKEKWLAKVKAVRDENNRRQKLNDRAEALSATISGVDSTYVLPTGYKSVKMSTGGLLKPKRRKKAAAAAPAKRRKKAAPKKAAPKRKTARKAAPRKAVRKAAPKRKTARRR